MEILFWADQNKQQILWFFIGFVDSGLVVWCNETVTHSRFLPIKDRNTTLNANERDLSLTSIHLRATRALPTLPVLIKIDKTPMTKKNIFKLFPQSTSHQPPTASPLGWDLEYSWTFSIPSFPAYQSFRYSWKQIKLIEF